MLFRSVYFNSPAKTGNHRALGDIKDSIAELAFYRKTVFVAAPGPESTDIKQIAALISESNGELTTNQD